MKLPNFIELISKITTIFHSNMDENIGNKPHYYAFISYCTEDEKWAKWFHRKLEHYFIPTRLCKEYPTLPKKIRPIFWYKVDLSGSKLKQSLERALSVSNYLIVLCSPNSANAPWVNDEIKSFMQKHGDDKIIPVIVAGEPKSDKIETECFPPILRNLTREDEIRGISISKEGKYHALVDIVATMFNVRFDVLWQRHRRRMIRNRLIGVLLILLITICGISAFMYFRTSKVYYANYEFCYGMPVGINLLEKSELKTMPDYYVFEYSRGKLRRVYNSNPFGHPMDENASWSQFRTAILDLSYEGNRLSSIIFSNSNKTPLYKLVYSEDFRKADIKDVESGDAASIFKSSTSTVENMFGLGTFDLNTVFQDSKSQIARYVYDYDKHGYISKIHFKRHNGSNEVGFDENGISGIEYVRDSCNRVIKKRYLDESNSYMPDKTGCAGCEYAYDAKGNVVYERFFDLNDHNHLSDMRYATSRIEYDYNAGIHYEMHYGIDEKPIMNLSNYFKARFEIKEDSLIISYFDTELKPTTMFLEQRGIGLFHQSKEIFDNKGNNIETAYYGIDGEPCYNINRVHRIKNEFDKIGRCIKINSYNIEGNAQLNSYGVSEIRISYVGDTDKPKLIEYYRRPGVRTNVMNISRREFSYEGNKVVKSVCYDSNDMPSYSPVNLGAHIVLLEYDDFGNVSDLWLKDTSGSTKYIKDNQVAHQKATYKNGNCVKLEFLNKHGRPVMNPSGYSIVLMNYDNRGRNIATEYLDASGKSVIISEFNFSRIEHDYDLHGHEIETRTYDDKHEPIICADGWAIKRQEYHDDMLLKISSFGLSGEPILAKNIDAHVKEFKYDANRRVVSEKYLGISNEPLLNRFGIHEIKYQYDTHGLPIEIANYNTYGNPINSTQGYHKRVNKFDIRNNMISEKYLDNNGKLVINNEFEYAYAESQFTKSGLLISIKAFGPDSRPVENNLGIHMILNKYSSSDDLLLCALLDKDNNPVSSVYFDQFFAIQYFKYNINGEFRGFVQFDDNFDEDQIVMPLISGERVNGYLYRNIVNMKLRLFNGIEKEIDIYSESPDDKNYLKTLDDFFEKAKREVQQLIKES